LLQILFNSMVILPFHNEPVLDLFLLVNPSIMDSRSLVRGTKFIFIVCVCYICEQAKSPAVKSFRTTRYGCYNFFPFITILDAYSLRVLLCV